MAMMEKVFVAKSKTADADKTLIGGTRYGNVIASRGQLFQYLLNKLKMGNL